MLYTLHSYILRELAKVFAITAVSLSVMLSLGSLLKPLRDQGVTANQMFELVFYSFPVTLTFSLPVAALLATTLVYGRLSADNEITACRASGIGTFMTVLPAVALGVVVLVGNLLLSNWIIPACAEQAKAVMWENVQDIIANKLKNDRQLNYKEWVITAEDVFKSPDHPSQIVLQAPSIARKRRVRVDGIDRTQLDAVIMCSQAVLQFEPGFDAVTVFPRSAVMMNGQSMDEPGAVYTQPLRWKIPPLTKDDVGFKTAAELRALRIDPEPFHKVRAQVDRCRRITEQCRLRDEIVKALHDGVPGSIAMQYEDLSTVPPTLREAIVYADSAVWIDEAKGKREGRRDNHVLIGQAGRRDGVRIDLLGPPGPDGQARPVVRYTAEQARLEIVSRDDDSGPMIDVKFPDAFVRQDLRHGGPAAKKAKGSMVERLLPPDQLIRDVGAIPFEQLEMTPAMRKALNKEVNELQNEIVAELHRRGAFSVAGLVLVLLGAALGILFRSGHVLVAFGLAAVPGMFAMLMVMMGNNMMTNSNEPVGAWGIGLIWLGNIVIVALNVFVYGRALRR